MNITRRIAYNTIIQIVGRVVGLFIMLITVNYISNHLIIDGSSVIGYGQYTIVFTYVSIIGVAADLGLFTLLVREIANKSKSEIEDLIGNALGFRFALFVLVFLLFLIINNFLPYPEVVKWGILIGIGSAFINLFSQIIAGLFQAKMITDRIVIAETIGKIVLAGLTILFLYKGYGLIWVVVANLLGNLTIFIISIIFARRYIKINLKFDLKVWVKTLFELGSIAMVTLLSLIHFKIDSLILSFYRPAGEVGIYGLSYKLLEIIAIIPSIYVANVMPHLSNLYNSQELEKMANFTKKSVSVIIAIAIPIAIIVYLMAPLLVVFISSEQFIQSAKPLQILIFAITFAFIAEVVTGSVTAARAQKKLIWAYLLAVIINIVANIIIIPIYSYTGAAYTTVATGLLLTICVLFIARKNIGKNIDWKSIIKISISAVVLVAILRLTDINFSTQINGFSEQGKLIQAIKIVEYSGAMLIIYGIMLWLLFKVKFNKNKLLTK